MSIRTLASPLVALAIAAPLAAQQGKPAPAPAPAKAGHHADSAKGAAHHGADSAKKAAHAGKKGEQHEKKGAEGVKKP